MSRICIVPRVEGLGGVTSFRLKFEQGLQHRGVKVTNKLSEPADAVLVLGGTKSLLALWRARRRGLRIVQRLDGMDCRCFFRNAIISSLGMVSPIQSCSSRRGRRRTAARQLRDVT